MPFKHRFQSRLPFTKKLISSISEASAGYELNILDVNKDLHGYDISLSKEDDFMLCDFHSKCSVRFPCALSSALWLQDLTQKNDKKAKKC